MYNTIALGRCASHKKAMELHEAVKQEDAPQWSQDDNDGGSSTESECFDEEPDEWVAGGSDNGARLAAAETEPAAPDITTHPAASTPAPLTVLSDSCFRCCKAKLPLVAFSNAQRMKGNKRPHCRSCTSARGAENAVRAETRKEKRMSQAFASIPATDGGVNSPTAEAAGPTAEPVVKRVSEKKRKRLEIQALRPSMTKAAIARERKKLKTLEREVSVDAATEATVNNNSELVEPTATEQTKSCTRCSKPLLSVEGRPTLLCACCNVKFPPGAFSKSQATDRRVIRRCLACVKGGAAIYEALKQEPAIDDAIHTKQLVIAQQNQERLKRVQDVHQLVSVKKLPRITRSQSAVLKKKQRPMDEEQQLDFAEQMRQLVFGRKEFFAQLTATDKTKGGTTKEERWELESKDARLNALEKKLFVRNQMLFNELYAVIK